MNITEKIHEHADIVDVIGDYINLKKKGANYQACCPFHNEKTPSFMVSPAKGIYKCFGCGKGGDAIEFVIEHEKVSFFDALQILGKKYGIEVKDQSPEAKEKAEKENKTREAITTVNEFALKHWQQNAQAAPAKVKGYIEKRLPEKELKEKFAPGFALNEWNDLLSCAEKNGYKRDGLIMAGVVKENDNKKVFDFYRNRLVLPVYSLSNKLIGFTARDLSNEEGVAKYLNSPENLLFNKRKTLFGLNLAIESIQQNGYLYKVEGCFDVSALHRIGIENVVAPLGTALTAEQVQLVKKRLPQCERWVLLNDGDQAGIKATNKAGKLLLQEGFEVDVLQLPEGEDPDSFAQSKEQFEDYEAKNIESFVMMYAGQKFEGKTSPAQKAKALTAVCKVLQLISDSALVSMYVEELAKKYKAPKKNFTDKLRQLEQEEETVIEQKKERDNYNQEHWEHLEKWGFYEHKNCYFFAGANGAKEGSNFVLKPLFHIESTTSPKRLYEITNFYGVKKIVEFQQKDLVTLSRFKEIVEGLGNFIWKGNEANLTTLKGFLYEETKTSSEVTQLGWQKKGFFAWGNGIFNGKFTPCDEYGIVSHEDENFYIPSGSKLYEKEEGLFQAERRFIHKEGSISLYYYASLLIEVFDNNAAVALCYYFATLFRDYLINKFNFFPILNLFGPKGAGKTELAVSMLKFFGNVPKGPNINSTSKPALADHVSQVCNALVHIDEYKNNLEFEKIEFLKGLWDGTGRTRMNMDKDRKKETTAVDSGVMLSGQDMPTADIALFSRLVFLSFYKCEFSEKEKQNFQNLKDIEKKGLTHITEELLHFRQWFKDHFDDAYQMVYNDLDKALKKEVIEDRTLKNWLMIIASYATLKDKVKLPFKYEHIIQLSIQAIRKQNQETKRSNEITTFWTIVEYMLAEGFIQEEVDFKIDIVNHLKTDLVKAEFKEPKKVIYLNHSRVLGLYGKHGKQIGENILARKTLEYYLQNDKNYLGKKKAQRFSQTFPGTNQIDEDKSKVTTAFCFDYSNLEKDINLETSKDIKEGDPFTPPKKTELENIEHN